MATDNKDNKLSIGGGDYAEILRQAVAVIGHDKKLQRSVALFPWSHNMLLLSKGLDDDATLYYATKTVEKVGITTCCSMPSNSKCMRHRHWQE